MSAPLGSAAREVLRALVHGLELHKTNGQWCFVGHWQDPARSGVSARVMHELFGCRFICQLSDSRVGITKYGEEALSQSTIAAIAAASK
jgi:lipopolysaccharide biosynthesis protein